MLTGRAQHSRARHYLMLWEAHISWGESMNWVMKAICTLPWLFSLICHISQSTLLPVIPPLHFTNTAKCQFSHTPIIYLFPVPTMPQLWAPLSILIPYDSLIYFYLLALMILTRRLAGVWLLLGHKALKPNFFSFNSIFNSQQYRIFSLNMIMREISRYNVPLIPILAVIEHFFRAAARCGLSSLFH